MSISIFISNCVMARLLFSIPFSWFLFHSHSSAVALIASAVAAAPCCCFIFYYVFRDLFFRCFPVFQCMHSHFERCKSFLISDEKTSLTRSTFIRFVDRFETILVDSFVVYTTVDTSFILFYLIEIHFYCLTAINCQSMMIKWKLNKKINKFASKNKV